MAPAQNDRRDWADIPMSARARNYYETVFIPRYEQYLQEVREQPLTVLLWGPSPADSSLYKKRTQLRGFLRERGIAAVFSEEVDQELLVDIQSVKTRELGQALAADLIVVLQASPGSIAEVHDFATFVSDLGSKMVIFIDERAQGGYSYTGALSELKELYGNVHTFTRPRDIDECNLCTAVLSRVETLRHARWRQEHVR